MKNDRHELSTDVTVVGSVSTPEVAELMEDLAKTSGGATKIANQIGEKLEVKVEFAKL